MGYMAMPIAIDKKDTGDESVPDAEAEDGEVEAKTEAGIDAKDSKDVEVAGDSKCKNAEDTVARDSKDSKESGDAVDSKDSRAYFF